MSNSYGFLHVVQAIHGDALMLEFDKGQSSVFMLVDGGPGQSYDRNGDDYSTTDNLFKLLTDLSNRSGQRRLEFIDTVVVTHDDEDHKNGIADLFRYLLQTANKPPIGTWTAGLTSMSSATPPIKQIWYNSQANLIQEYISKKKPTPKELDDWGWLETAGPRMGSPKNGWFDALLEKFNENFRSAPDVSFNQEFDPQRQTTTLVSHGVRARPSGTNLVRRAPYAFKILGPNLDQDLINEKFIKELVKTSVREEKRVSNKPARTHSGDGANLTASSKSRSSDYSPKNRSSIAFHAYDQQQKVPSLLMLGDAVLGSQIDPGEYTIMKIAHHGSAHNNYALPKKYGLTYVEIKVSPGVLQDAFRFFNYVKAKKFVISASPTEGSPNPHVTTILAIYLAAVELGRKVDVYMTNKLPRNALKGLMYFLFGPERATYPGANGKDEQILEKKAKLSQNLIDRLKKFDDHMKIWLLKPDVPYGSIPFNDDDPSTDFWIPITEEELRVELSPSLAKSAIAAKARAVSKRIQATVGTAAPGPSTSKKKKP